MEGIKVRWGYPRADGGPVGARRFKVSIGSKPLWHAKAQGLDAYDLARRVLDELAGELWQRAPADREVDIRRVDSCVDHWGYTWTRNDLARFASRASTRRSEENLDDQVDDVETPVARTREHVGKHSSTYYVGSRGTSSEQLRVYNKTVEARESGKTPWMERAWRAHGWDGKAIVWRAEIELGGQWCQDHGLKTLADLRGAEFAVWRDYFTRTRHTTGSRSRNKRAPTSRVWDVIADLVERGAQLRGEAAAWTWQPRPPRDDADMETLTAMGQGVNRKLADSLFPGWDRDDDARRALFDYLLSAMRAGAKRSVDRAARIAARAGPAPPPADEPPFDPTVDPPPLPPIRGRSPNLAGMVERARVVGDAIAAGFAAEEEERLQRGEPRRSTSR